MSRTKIQNAYLGWINQPDSSEVACDSIIVLQYYLPVDELVYKWFIGQTSKPVRQEND
jgi:hypothetical protein